MDIVIHGNNIILDDELVFYSRKLREYNSFRDIITNQVVNKINKGDIENAKDIVDIKLKDLINEIISEISRYEIYDKTVEDFISSNEGYLNFLQAFLEYFKIVNNISSKNESEAQRRISDAADRAESQIRGLDFGIITNDILSYSIYKSMNDSKIKKSTQKAYKEFENESNRIYSLLSQKTDNEIVQYRNDVLIPSVETSISKMISTLFTQYISLLASCNQFNLECIRNINESRANSILNNMSIVDDKRKLLSTSINLCPYNLPTYVIAVQYGLFDEGMGEIISTFQLSDELKSQLIKKYDFNQYKIVNLDLTYIKIKNMITSLSYMYGLSEKEIFTDLAYNHLKSKINEVRRFLINCKEKNKDMRLSLLKSKFNKVVDYESSIKRLFEGVISRAEVDCIQEFTNVDFFVEISDDKDISVFSSYDEILNYIVDSFSDCKSEFFDYIKDEEERIRNEEIRKQEEEREKEERENKRVEKIKKIIIASFVVPISAFLIIAIVNKIMITKEKNEVREQYLNYIEQNGEPFCGLEFDMSYGEVVAILGEPNETQKDDEDGLDMIYNDVTVFGENVRMIVELRDYNAKSPDSSKLSQISIYFDKNISEDVARWYEYYFDIKYSSIKCNSNSAITYGEHGIYLRINKGGFNVITILRYGGVDEISY